MIVDAREGPSLPQDLVTYICLQQVVALTLIST
jgi:hypothetical protein